MTLSSLFDIAPYSWSAIVAPLFAAQLLVWSVNYAANLLLRTSALIVLGTYLFLATAFMLHGDVIDHSRVVGQIITGIGFLGAGVMLAKDGAVVGVTSAATIWVLASIGVVIATNNLLAAIKLSVLVVGILYGVDVLEAKFKSLGRGVHARVKRYSKLYYRKEK